MKEVRVHAALCYPLKDGRNICCHYPVKLLLIVASSSTPVACLPCAVHQGGPGGQAGPRDLFKSRLCNEFMNTGGCRYEPH